MVEFTEDENKVVMAGHRYRAEEGAVGKCDGCFMKNGFGCFLVEEALRGVPVEEMKMGAGKCMPPYRADGRQVIWVLDVEHCVPR